MSRIVAISRLNTAFVRAAGSVCQLVLSLVLAHAYGAGELGRFLVFVALVNVMIAIGGGLPNLLIRYGSRDEHERSRDHVGWLWRHSLTLATACLLLAAAAGVLGAEYLRDLALAAAGLLVQRAASSVLKARRRPALGIFLDAVLYPIVVLAFVALSDAAAWDHVTQHLRFAYVGAVWFSALLGLALGWRDPNSPRTSWQAPLRTPRALFGEIIRVTLGAAWGAVAAQVPLAVAPLLLTDDETGSLGLALRVAGFAGTLIVSLNASFGPAFAGAASGAELLELRRQSQRASLLLYVPFLVAFFAIPRAWLELVDPALTSVKLLVAVLSVGYLVNAATGLCINMLVMRGRARTYSRVNAYAAWLTVVAVVGGGVLGGVWGLAAGLSLSIALANLYFFRASSEVIRAELAAGSERNGPSFPGEQGGGTARSDSGAGSRRPSTCAMSVPARGTRQLPAADSL